MTSNRSIWDGIPEGLDGDRTTTGSCAISSLPNFSTEGIGALRHGDKTTPCPACGQVGELIGNIPFVTLHGRCAAGHNAVVTCGCPPGSNRLISPAGPVGRGGLQSTRAVSQPQPVQHAQTTHRHPLHQQANQHEEALPITCACDRDITMAEFRQIATCIADENLKNYLDAINLWMPWFGLTTCREKTHFLAQVCGETSAFKYLSEINGPQASYAPWYGRGLLQLTGQHNYQSYSDYSDDTIMFHEDKLLSLPHSVLSALWYYCNKTSCLEHSRIDDFNMITCIINGGINGYNNRLNYFQSISRILKSEHLNSLCIDNEFLFENSDIYDNATYALSWALWHDPQTHFQGPTKDLSESRKGYERAKTLWGADQQRIHDHRKLYGIYRNHIESFIIKKLQERQ